MPQQLKDIREIILGRIATILEHEYRDPVTDLTEDILTAKLAFKAHPQLNELRLALERMKRGEYGRCIFCKGSIGETALAQNPTAHFCNSCSGELRRGELRRGELRPHLQSPDDHPDRAAISA
ncbi:MAG: hypothetical protein KFF77_02380 [Bacteroidetes bacterium]|nr:hypothetical protein [Bacteroidota bacterium]